MSGSLAHAGRSYYAGVRRYGPLGTVVSPRHRLGTSSRLRYNSLKAHKHPSYIPIFKITLLLSHHAQHYSSYRSLRYGAQSARRKIHSRCRIRAASAWSCKTARRHPLVVRHALGFLPRLRPAGDEHPGHLSRRGVRRAVWLDVWSEWGSHPCSSFLHFLRIVILPVRLDLAPVTIALIPPAGALFFLLPSPFFTRTS